MSSTEENLKQPGTEVVDSHVLPDNHGTDVEVGIINKAAPLARDLRGRHMQMIAMGKSTSSSRPGTS